MSVKVIFLVKVVRNNSKTNLISIVSPSFDVTIWVRKPSEVPRREDGDRRNTPEKTTYVKTNLGTNTIGIYPLG